MALVRLEKVSLAYGHHTLLDGVDLEIRRGERVCLVGRNGEGKSSLLRLISGETLPDDGRLWHRPATRIACLAQEITLDSRDTVFEVVAGGLSGLGRLVSEYHREAVRVAHSGATERIARLAELQHRLEAADGWRLEQRVETVLARLRLQGDAAFPALSGGWRRRVMLARALVCEPDVLLLDEPTNHLDIEAITWLEDFMREFSGALLFISHDRAFVRRLATRILELDRGRLTSWPGDYPSYERGKAERLEVEARQAALFDRKLSLEEAWIRQGIQARRTRNQGRVRALRKLREERRRRRERVGTVNLQLEDGAHSGKRVIAAEGISKRLDGQELIRDFSVSILRGDRVGIIGPNGAGKTTLIRLLLGELPPDGGRIRHGTGLEVAYFDQQRERLDPQATVMESVGDGSQRVTIQGRSRHVAGYLQEFLFPPQRLHSPVSSLSGGERNRLLLARLFARPANLLVMDEPTNDLDVETLERLEEMLLTFRGTLLLASHDREFLDNVVTSILVFEGEGRIGEYTGGYGDWQRLVAGVPPPVARNPKPAVESPVTRRSAPSRRLSYQDRRELEALPARIETLEKELSRLQATVSAAAFYRQPQEQITTTLAELERLGTELEGCYDRWEALEAMPSR